jgi:hypothetical protein
MAGRRLLLVLATCLAPAAASGQTLVFELEGSHAITAVGDLDGDGVSELAVGSEAEAKVRLFSGADGSLLQTVSGALGNRFGAAVAGPGDLTGDGVPDLVVGAPITPSGSLPAGAVHFVSLATGEIYAEIPAPGDAAKFGAGLAVLSDLDGDGVAEIAVSAPDDIPFSEDHNGAVVILSGTDGAVLTTLLPPDLPADASTMQFGQGLASGGDRDGDGRVDLIIGMPSFPFENVVGHVFVYGSASLLDPGGPQLLLDATVGSIGFGESVADAGDVDGDGVSDVIAGAVFGAGPGQTEPAGVLVSGADGEVIHVITPSASTNDFGASVAGPGDLDQDGVPDVLVGGPGVYLFGVLGRVVAVSGATGERLFELSGTTLINDEFGVPVVNLGDLTGDGVHEFAVGDGVAGVMQVRSVLGVWTDLGFGLAGASGTPTLSGEGQLLGGDALCITVGGGPPGAPGWLFLGFGFVSAPFFGGTMVPEWITIHDLPPLDASGALDIPGRWPVDAPSVALYAQAWFLDPTGPQGASATNGVEAKAP